MSSIKMFCFVCFHLMGYALCRRPPTIAHYFKIVDSWHFYKQIRGSWCPDLSFGMLGASTLASWGTLRRSWDSGEHKKDHWKVRAWIFIDLAGFRDTILTAFWFWDTLDKKCVFWYTCFLASDFVSNVCWVWIWMSGIGKPSTNFHKFYCSGDWLEIWWHSRWFWGHTRSKVSADWW